MKWIFDARDQKVGVAGTGMVTDGDISGMTVAGGGYQTANYSSLEHRDASDLLSFPPQSRSGGTHDTPSTTENLGRVTSVVKPSTTINAFLLSRLNSQNDNTFTDTHCPIQLASRTKTNTDRTRIRVLWYTAIRSATADKKHE